MINIYKNVYLPLLFGKLWSFFPTHYLQGNLPHEWLIIFYQCDDIKCNFPICEIKMIFIFVYPAEK